MAITFEPVALESAFGDEEGMLAFREGRLIAALARLGQLHDEHGGRWFVEAAFTDEVRTGEMFDGLTDLESRISAPAGGTT